MISSRPVGISARTIDITQVRYRFREQPVAISPATATTVDPEPLALNAVHFLLSDVSFITGDLWLL
jgi:hypothetical protein